MLRRKGAQGNSKTVLALNKLIVSNGAHLIGAIRQEVLSGIRDPRNFVSIRDILRLYPEVTPDRSDYELAGECYTACLSKGISPSHVDMLICAVSIRHALEILTLDKDFDHYAKAIPIRLFKV
jgi:predicted nucleic acid-binding protein